MKYLLYILTIILLCSCTAQRERQENNQVLFEQALQKVCNNMSKDIYVDEDMAHLQIIVGAKSMDCELYNQIDEMRSISKYYMHSQEFYKYATNEYKNLNLIK